jgi:hypothetical protein
MPGRPLTNGTGGGAQNGSSAAQPNVTPAVLEALARPPSWQQWADGYLGRIRLLSNGQLRYDIHAEASSLSRVTGTVPVALKKGYSEGARACRRLTRAVNQQGVAELARAAIVTNRIGPTNGPDFINGFGLGFRATATQISEANPNAPPRYIGS